MRSSSDADIESSKDVTEEEKTPDGDRSESNGPSLPISSISTWARRALGSLICLAAPLYKRVLMVEGEVEKAAETAIGVAEKVTKVVEKVASDVAEALPNDSPIKQEVIEFEHFAEEVDDGAEQAYVFIHKVDHIKEEVEDLVEPIIEEGEEIEKETQENKEKKEKLI